MCVCKMCSTLLFPVVSLQPVPSEATLQHGDEPKEERNTPKAPLVPINSCVRLRAGSIIIILLLLQDTIQVQWYCMPINGILA